MTGEITSDRPRRVLMLQGPHGPFFHQLARALRKAGADVWRVGFNRGDEAFWGREGYLPYTGCPEDWPARCTAILDEKAITDLVLYGDARPAHAAAITLAKAQAISGPIGRPTNAAARTAIPG
jgi:capsular polysaccharide export protein